MFALKDSWVWDFWFADDGDRYHLFYLFAPKKLQDPDDRHYHASIGHAVSDDLTNWSRVDDALVHGESGDFDELATWTGSTVRHPNGTWYMFYTGTTLVEGKNVQRIGYATSPDLCQWSKQGQVAEADPRWYELLADQGWHDEAFRDPWVFADPDGNGWHMLVTARGNYGPTDDRGVVGYCWSPDLESWEVREPLTRVGQGFGQLEVMLTVKVEGQWFLLFSCLAADSSALTKATGTPGGTWAAKAETQTGPYDIAGSKLISPPGLYVGRLVQLRETGEWKFMAFVNEEGEGHFGGRIIDPLPVSLLDGELVIG
ncbi:MAG: family 43 glycosylhydrolase [Propionibacteriaceae bacterium]|nr:family 43 glycosylhydrolase [Propionibacteriaceae bacterium]